MIYVDTSVLVAASTREPATEAAQCWLGAQARGDLAISGWTVAEFFGALAFKLRTGALSPEHRVIALDGFNASVGRSLTVWPIAHERFNEAARLAGREALKLRAPDALHLAIAADRKAAVCTLDRTMQAAAEVIGLATVSP